MHKQNIQFATLPVYFVETNAFNLATCLTLSPHASGTIRNLDQLSSEHLPKNYRPTGFDATCPYENQSAQQEWIRLALELATDWDKQYHLQCFILLISTQCSQFKDATDYFAKQNPLWTYCCSQNTASRFDDAIDAHRWIMIATKSNQPAIPFTSPDQARAPRRSSTSRPVSTCLNKLNNLDNCVICQLPDTTAETTQDNLDIWLPQPVAIILNTRNKENLATTIICDKNHPAPESRPFSNIHLGCTFQDTKGNTRMRYLSTSELLSTYSFPYILRTTILSRDSYSAFTFTQLLLSIWHGSSLH
jgi:hypothetical protein